MSNFDSHIQLLLEFSVLVSFFIFQSKTRSDFGSKLLKRKEEKLTYAAKQAARAELIMQEEAG